MKKHFILAVVLGFLSSAHGQESVIYDCGDGYQNRSVLTLGADGQTVQLQFSIVDSSPAETEYYSAVASPEQLKAMSRDQNWQLTFMNDICGSVTYTNENGQLTYVYNNPCRDVRESDVYDKGSCTAGK